MNGLDLFSGIGGISIALEPWVRTVAYCENDRYAQSVILSRIADGQLDAAPIWDDVTTLRAEMLPKIDIIFGGFPCQDISVAGLGKGLDGKRSGLFYEIIRLTKEIRPTFVFLENVPAIRTRGLEQVIKAFTEMGYDCRWTMLSAKSVGANHKRERWFLLAYSDSVGQLPKQEAGQISTDRPSNGSQDMADSLCEGLERQRKEPSGVQKEESEISVEGWWKTEPAVGRVVDVLPYRVDRIKCLGNAVVPLQAREAFKKLIGLDTEGLKS